MDRIYALEVERSQLNTERQKAAQQLALLFNEQDKLNKEKRNLEQEIKKQTDNIDRMKMNMLYQSPEHINNILQKLEYEMRYQKNSKWEQKRLQEEIQKLKKNKEDLPILYRKEQRVVQKKSELEDKAKEYMALQTRISEQREVRNRVLQTDAIIERELRDLRIACCLPPSRPSFGKHRRSWGSRSNHSISSALSTADTNSPVVCSSPQGKQSPTLSRPTLIASEEVNFVSPDVPNDNRDVFHEIQDEAVTPMASTSHSCGNSALSTRSMAQIVANWSTIPKLSTPSKQLIIDSEVPFPPTNTPSTSATYSSDIAADSTSFTNVPTEINTNRLSEQIRRQQHSNRQTKLYALEQRHMAALDEIQKCEKLLNYFQNLSTIRQRGRSRPSRRLFLPVDICCDLKHFNVPIPSAYEHITESVLPLLQALNISCQERGNKLNRRIQDYRLENQEFIPGSFFHLPFLQRVSSVDAASTITDSAFSEQSVNLTNILSSSEAIAVNSNALISSTPSNPLNMTCESTNLIEDVPMRNISSQPMLLSPETETTVFTSDKSPHDKSKVINSCSSSVYCSADELEHSGSGSPCEDALASSGYTVCSAAQRKAEGTNSPCKCPSSDGTFYLESHATPDPNQFELSEDAAGDECQMNKSTHSVELYQMLNSSTNDDDRPRRQSSV